MEKNHPLLPCAEKKGASRFKFGGAEKARPSVGGRKRKR